MASPITEVTEQVPSWIAGQCGTAAVGRSGRVCSAFFPTALRALSRRSLHLKRGTAAPLPANNRKEFLRLCPEFVIEVLSPSDSLKTAQAKMEQWIANGAQLAWLIDGDSETVYIYEKDKPVETRQGHREAGGQGAGEGLYASVTHHMGRP